MERILYGKPVADALIEKSLQCIKEAYRGRKPALAVVRIGNDEASISYIKGLMKSCERANVEVLVIEMEESIAQEAACQKVCDLSADSKIDGILLQLPLPKHLDERALIECIAVDKDVDGITMGNAGRFWLNQRAFTPCTAQAVIEVAKYYQIPLAGKRVVIFGRSQIVGKPLVQCFLNEHATVSIAHSKTLDCKQLALDSDIIVSAVGKADFIQRDWMNQQVIFDVGINFKEGKLCGDVSNTAYEQADAYTPVPKGIGVVTNAVLISHVVEAYKRR